MFKGALTRMLNNHRQLQVIIGILLAMMCVCFGGIKLYMRLLNVSNFAKQDGNELPQVERHLNLVIFGATRLGELCCHS